METINEKIRQMYRDGVSRSDIISELGVRSTRISEALKRNPQDIQLPHNDEAKYEQAIKLFQLDEYRTVLRRKLLSLNDSDRFVKVFKKVLSATGHEYGEKVEYAEITGVYPHVVTTTAGDFKLKEIYMWNVRNGRFV